MQGNAVSKSRLIWEFLSLGSLGFGGPLSLAALLRQRLVERQKWVSGADFDAAFTYCKLLPGPVAFQLVVWLGRDLGGRLWGLLGGLAFLFPSFMLMLVLSASYGKFGIGPAVQGLRLGAVAVVGWGVWQMGRGHLRSRELWVFGPLAGILLFFHPAWEPYLVISSGIAAIVGRRYLQCAVGPLLALFWVHFRSAFTVFGTGLAVIPVLQAEVIMRGWMPAQEFLDGLAFGQITPGPITITATFIGFRVQGICGAFAATLGMYLPGLILILFLVPWVLRRVPQPLLEHFGKGALGAVLGCLVPSVYFLASQTVQQGRDAVFLLLALVAGAFAPAGLVILGSGLLYYVATSLF